MITVGITGLMGSETRACNGWLSIGRRMPAIAANTDECPEATTPIFGVRISP